MKKIIPVLFILLIPFLSKGNTLDTIATWKVYYNNSLIKNLSVVSDKSIIIDRKKYKSGDYLTIQYFDDMPCESCNYVCVVRGEGKMEISKIKFTGKNKFIKIDLKELQDYLSKTDPSYFSFFLYGPNDKRGIRLITLKID
ncbi:hypothetical protein [Flavobacterium sp. FlaQc-48]|uniref:hypothetical protein n=1 Tax=Flavobacterium sp. FlaQc-48 TaxID=3374181 RepID=UPI003757B781